MVYIYKGKAAKCQPLAIVKLTFDVGIFDIPAERMRFMQNKKQQVVSLLLNSVACLVDIDYF